MAGVKAMDHTLFDEFKIKGIWWNPNNPEKKEAGFLFFSEMNIELELIGSLKEKYLNSGLQEYEILHGVSDKGENFTLMHCYVKKFEFSAPGFQTETFSIHSFIVGDCFDSLEEIHFHSISFQPTYLTEWIGRHVFLESKMKSDDENSSFNGETVSINQVDNFSYYIDSLQAKITETQLTKISSDPSKKVLWTNKSGIEIVPDKKMNLLWFEKNMYLFNDLLNLFIGHATYFESILLFGDEQQIKDSNYKIRKEHMYFFKQDKSKLKDNFHWSDVILSFKDVDKDLHQIINLWFKNHQSLEVVYDLHFGDFYKNVYIDVSFLNAIQVLEIYHRKNFEGKIYDKIEYRRLKNQLREVIENKFPEDFVKIVESKVNYGNEFSLAMRVKEIIFNFREETRAKLLGNEEQINVFIRQLVDTRNYLTHYDSDAKKYLLREPIQKYYAIQRLKSISTLILFLEVGLEEELMITKIMGSRQYSDKLITAKEILNYK